MLTGKLATRLQVSQWVLLKILGQDFENRTVHRHQEFSGVPPGDLKPGSKFTCQHPLANYQML